MTQLKIINDIMLNKYTCFLIFFIFSNNYITCQNNEEFDKFLTNHYQEFTKVIFELCNHRDVRLKLKIRKCDVNLISDRYICVLDQACFTTNAIKGSYEEAISNRDTCEIKDITFGIKYRKINPEECPKVIGVPIVDTTGKLIPEALVERIKTTHESLLSHSEGIESNTKGIGSNTEGINSNRIKINQINNSLKRLETKVDSLSKLTNSKFKNLRDDLSIIRKSISNLMDSIKVHRNNLRLIHTNIRILKRDYDNLKNRVSALEKQLSNLANEFYDLRDYVDLAPKGIFCPECFPRMGIGLSGGYFIIPEKIYNDLFDKRISIGIDVLFRVTRVLGLNFEFNHILFNIMNKDTLDLSKSVSIPWENNIFSASLRLEFEIPGTVLMTGFELGGFFGNKDYSNVYKDVVNYSDWYGYKGKFQLSLAEYYTKNLVDFNLSISYFNFIDPEHLYFKTTDQFINDLDQHAFLISLGIRFNFWNNMFTHSFNSDPKKKD